MTLQMDTVISAVFPELYTQSRACRGRNMLYYEIVVRRNHYLYLFEPLLLNILKKNVKTTRLQTTCLLRSQL